MIGDYMSSVNKILLFGSTGMFGHYVYSYFKQSTNINIIPIHYRISEKDGFDLLEQTLIDHGINDETCVINCVGLIPQRKNHNSSDKEYFLINSLFPHMLWQFCKKYNAQMIHPTTDCVFSGKKGGYVESDVHDELGSYGMSKSLGEPLGCTCIRTSIIGRELLNKKSFLEWVISNNNGTINGWSNHMWNGITCLEYCEVIEKIIKEHLFWQGVRHIYSPTPISKYEMAKIISEVFDLNIEINPLESAESCDKTLLSNYNTTIMFDIKELDVQIRNLKKYILLPIIK